MYKVGNISMDEDAYNKFVSLSKEQQTERVFNAMKPVSMDAVELALKDVPNGDNISKGGAKPTNEGDTKPNKGTGSASGDARSNSDKG